MPIPCFEFLEDGCGDLGDQSCPPGDGVAKRLVRSAGIIKQHEDGVPEALASAGLNQPDSERGAIMGRRWNRQELGDAARDFGIGVIEELEHGRPGGLSQCGESLLGALAATEVRIAELQGPRANPLCCQLVGGVRGARRYRLRAGR